MPEHILPLPPRWERDLDCGWIEYKSGADDIRGYLAKPKRSGRLPGLVMLHENLGVIEHRQDVTRRLAKAGFVAITVDLYSRIGGISPRDFKTPQERRIKASLANPDEQGVRDAEATCRYLESMDEVDRDRIGAVGYCSGGGTLYSWLCGHSTNIKAAVCFYGTVVTDAQSRADGKPLDRAEKAHLLQCPIQIHHGDADRAVDISESRRMVAALKNSGQPVEAHIYAGADHAYHDDTHPHHHADASVLSWTRTIDFLNRHVTSAPAVRAAAG
jgi:carboxymethylenebutenolidase